MCLAWLRPKRQVQNRSRRRKTKETEKDNNLFELKLNEYIFLIDRSWSISNTIKLAWQAGTLTFHLEFAFQCKIFNCQLWVWFLNLNLRASAALNNMRRFANWIQRGGKLWSRFRWNRYFQSSFGDFQSTTASKRSKDTHIYILTDVADVNTN